MQPSEKGILYQLAEEAAYSAKGHFKTADWMGISASVYIFVPLITSIVTLIFKVPEVPQRIISFVGFLFSLIALVSVWANNREKCDQTIKKHHDLANRYLEICKQVRSEIFSGQTIANNAIQNFQSSISQLDRESGEYPIGLMGRMWSRLVINREMDLDWLYK